MFLLKSVHVDNDYYQTEYTTLIGGFSTKEKMETYIKDHRLAVGSNSFYDYEEIPFDPA